MNTGNTCITPQGWSTFDDTPYGGFAHVVPNYGPTHYMTPKCWCHPSETWMLDNVVVHNVPQ